jgi:XRE family transcriptional regulator, regulator of sulfur utilization
LDLGPRLKQARQRSGLSLRALGERTGFSASFLSQVELGQSSPSLSSLHRIAQALEVPLGSLIAEAPVNGEAIVRRRDQSLKSEWSRATLRSLVPAGVDARMSAILVSLDPGGKSGSSPASAPGQEFAYCLRGTLQVTLDDERHEFGEGDSIVYDTQRRVQWENVGDVLAEVLFVSLRS